MFGLRHSPSLHSQGEFSRLSRVGGGCHGAPLCGIRWGPRPSSRKFSFFLHTFVILLTHLQWCKIGESTVHFQGHPGNHSVTFLEENPNVFVLMRGWWGVWGVWDWFKNDLTVFVSHLLVLPCLSSPSWFSCNWGSSTIYRAPQKCISRARRGTWKYLEVYLGRRWYIIVPIGLLV